MPFNNSQLCFGHSTWMSFVLGDIKVIYLSHIDEAICFKNMMSISMSENLNKDHSARIDYIS